MRIMYDLTYMTLMTYLTWMSRIIPMAIGTGYQKLKSPIFAAPDNYRDT